MSETKTEWKGRTLLFLISQCITLFGSTLVQMAVVWYVTLRTSSGAWVAAFTVCAYLPQFLISFISGVWADRYSRKKLIIGADTLIALVTLLMWIAMPFISADPALLLCLLIMSSIRSLGSGVQTPAVNAVIPQLVPVDQLMRYNGINATMQSVVQFAAPAAAGALLTAASLRSALLLDIGTAVVGIGLFASVALPRMKPQSEVKPVFEEMKIGIRYSFSNSLLRKLLMVYGLFIFLCVPAGFLAQLFVSRTFGDAYWYLTAVEVVGFIGMALGGILMSTWGGFTSRIKTLLTGIVLFGLLAIGMGMSNNLILYLSLMLPYGIALTMVQTVTMTLIQENAEMTMQGRVFGLLGSMYSGFLPLGMVVFGPLADLISLRWIMMGSGVALILIALLSRFPKKTADQSTSLIY